MQTITLEIPDELAERLKPYRDKMAQILQVGLRVLESVTKPAVTSREQMLTAIRSTGLIRPLDDIIARKYVPDPRRHVRQKPLKIAGKPVSEIIVEQRGPH
ncbi:MAG: hypothetical protein AAB427_03765 [Chloroflexota bacterium]